MNNHAKFVMHYCNYSAELLTLILFFLSVKLCTVVVITKKGHSAKS